MVDRIRFYTHTQRMLPLLLLLWLAALIPAARTLLKYEGVAGAMHPAPSHWPNPGTAAGEMSYTDRHENEGLLVIAVHPLCSCTRATLEELEDSAPSWQHPYHAMILLYTPKGHTASSSISSFTQAAYIRDAAQALHAELLSDEGGEQAARLGALTSGEVLYYSAADKLGQRRLLFSGGVTGGRGMVGENSGIQALEHAVQATSPQPRNSQEAHSPVYGCGLAALPNPNSTSSTETSAGRPTGSSTRSPAR